MKTGIVQDTTSSAKNLAQQVARQMARESLEILKNAREQATGEELSGQSDNQTSRQSDDQKKLIENQNHVQDQIKSSRRMEALQKEIEDIRKQKIFSDLQRRISGGEQLPLEDYPELSIDQKQVLNAQMEAYQNQRLKIKNQNILMEVPVIHSKPSRRFGTGQKSQAQKEQTRVEKPIPPSG